MSEVDIMGRITINREIFGGKPIIRGRRIAVEHILAMLAAGDSADGIVKAFPFLEEQDVEACLLFARRSAVEERVEPFIEAA